MTRTRVLISGASIAGPSLAYWLQRHGDEVTVVERAPALREGGHGVDFRGAQMELLRRMELTEAIRAGRHQDGRAGGGGRLTAQPRPAACGVHERRDRDPAPRRFDLVVGADGLHSRVRTLAFGAEEQFSTFLGYYTAGWTMPNVLGLEHSGLLCNEPGIGATISSGRDGAVAAAGLTFAADELPYDRRDQDEIASIVAARCAGAGWEVPRLVAALREATDLYFEAKGAGTFLAPVTTAQIRRRNRAQAAGQPAAAAPVREDDRGCRQRGHPRRLSRPQRSERQPCP